MKKTHNEMPLMTRWAATLPATVAALALGGAGLALTGCDDEADSTYQAPTSPTPAPVTDGEPEPVTPPMLGTERVEGEDGNTRVVPVPVPVPVPVEGNNAGSNNTGSSNMGGATTRPSGATGAGTTAGGGM